MCNNTSTLPTICKFISIYLCLFRKLVPLSRPLLQSYRLWYYQFLFDFRCCTDMALIYWTALELIRSWVAHGTDFTEDLQAPTFLKDYKVISSYRPFENEKQSHTSSTSNSVIGGVGLGGDRLSWNQICENESPQISSNASQRHQKLCSNISSLSPTNVGSRTW